MAHRGIHMDEQKARQGEIAELIVKKNWKICHRDIL